MIVVLFCCFYGDIKWKWRYCYCELLFDFGCISDGSIYSYVIVKFFVFFVFILFFCLCVFKCEDVYYVYFMCL